MGEVSQSPHGVNYQAYRPVVMGRRGMVCSGHPLASQAGVAMLQRGGNAVAIGCDVTDTDSLNSAAKRVVAELGPSDGSINGAGGNCAEATTSPRLSFFDLPPDAIRFVLDLNLLGSVLPAQVFGRQMAAQRVRAQSSDPEAHPGSRSPGPGGRAVWASGHSG